MHRFFLTEQDSVNEAEVLIVSEDLIHQFVRVLRFKAGERIVLLGNSGVESEVELGVEVEGKYPKRIPGKVIDKRVCKTELPFKLVLAFAILRNSEKVEWILQKGTELGISEFVPMITDRTERKTLFKFERMQRILKEAAEQSGRGVIPKLLQTAKFEKIFDGESEIVFSHPNSEKNFGDFVLNTEKKIFVCVGPEGGFTDFEVDFAKKNKAFSLNLGPRILRSETASIVVAGLFSTLGKFGV